MDSVRPVLALVPVMLNALVLHLIVVTELVSHKIAARIIPIAPQENAAIV